MARIRCKVLIDPSSFGNENSPNLLPIPNVSVILMDPVTRKGVVAQTDPSGECTFENVPIARKYSLIESWGFKTGPNVIDFSMSDVLSDVIPKDPTIDDVNFPNKNNSNANRVTSLTPNTIYFSINTTNVNKEFYYYFLDAPVEQIYFVPLDISISEINLISDANSGTFGSLPTGSKVQTSPNKNVYPTISPVYGYDKYGDNLPTLGNLSITNIIKNSNFNGKWWNISDHTSGDETGRMLIVSPSKESIFFNTTVLVEPNTDYILSFWVCSLNLNPSAPFPQIDFAATDKNGTTFVSSEIRESQTASLMPVWRELTVLFNSKSNSELNLRLISNDPPGSDSYFALDDISFKKFTSTDYQPPVTSLTKSVDKPVAAPGDDLTYTIIFSNFGPTVASNCFIIDTIPADTTFTKDSLTINDTPQIGDTLPTTISLHSLSPNSTTKISYKVTINSSASISKISTTASVNFIYISNINDESPFTITSNKAETTISKDILHPKVTLLKSVDKATANLNDILTYTITFKNIGSIAIIDASLYDYLPTSVEFIPDSLRINNLPSPGMPPNIPLNGLLPNDIKTISYQVRIKNYEAKITNSAGIDYSYNNGTTITSADIESNVAATDVSDNFLPPIVALDKYVDKPSATVGSTLTYTIIFKNSGPINVDECYIIDELPQNTTFITDSLVINNNPAPPFNDLPQNIFIGSLTPDQSTTISYKVTINNTQSNIVNIAKAKYSYSNNGVIENADFTSNPIETTILNLPSNILTLSMNSNKKTVDLYDSIKYSILIVNTSEYIIKHLTLINTLSQWVSFAKDSFCINNKYICGFPNLNCLDLGVLFPGENLNISFSVKVTDLPLSRYLYNMCKIKYDVLLNSSPINFISSEINSNQFKIFINAPNNNQCNCPNCVKKRNYKNSQKNYSN